MNRDHTSGAPVAVRASIRHVVDHDRAGDRRASPGSSGGPVPRRAVLLRGVRLLHGQWPGILGSGGLDPWTRSSSACRRASPPRARSWGASGPSQRSYGFDAAGVSVDACAEAVCLAGAALAVAAMWLAIVTRRRRRPALGRALRPLPLRLHRGPDLLIVPVGHLAPRGGLPVRLSAALRPVRPTPPVVVVWLSASSPSSSCSCPARSRFRRSVPRGSNSPRSTTTGPRNRYPRGWRGSPRGTRRRPHSWRRRGVALEGPMAATLVAPSEGADTRARGCRLHSRCSSPPRATIASSTFSPSRSWCRASATRVHSLTLVPDFVDFVPNARPRAPAPARDAASEGGVVQGTLRRASRTGRATEGDRGDDAPREGRRRAKRSRRRSG